MLSFSPSVIGFIAGMLCTISFIPQVVKIFKAKSAADLSLMTFAVFSCGVFLWLIYGFMIGELPIILANAATLLLVCCIVIMKMLYK